MVCSSDVRAVALADVAASMLAEALACTRAPEDPASRRLRDLHRTLEAFEVVACALVERDETARAGGSS